MPKISAGRQDLQADAAQGPQVLGRHARQGLRLRARDQARAQPGVGRLAPSTSASTGAQEYVDAGKCDGDISGITTDDKTGDITIKLTAPDGSFTNVLAMWFAGLVPGDTPFKNLTEDPPPGVGPYKVTESVPNRQFVLEKNAELRPNLGPEHPGRATSTRSRPRSSRTPQRQAQDVISGKLDYMQDPPPADIKPEVKAKYSDRYREITTASTYYMFMNTRVAAVRQEEGARGGQLRASTSPRSRACSPARSRRAARSCRRACRATTRRST